MKKRLLASLMSLCLLVGLFPSTVLAVGTGETEYAKTLYVDADGQADGTGTREAPFLTLEEAVGAAAVNGQTMIYVMSDIILTSMIGIWEKDVIIASDPVAMEEHNRQAFTISRGDNFQTSRDSARSGYNPAMIEVGGTTGQGVVAYLRLENIVLDDQGKAQGGTGIENKTYFIQAASDGDGNTDFGDLTTENNTPISNTNIVQDAIIATYNGTGEITLGFGAVLKNYGGMSAVRLSGGTLTMESGSIICDDKSMNRTKGDTITGADTGLYGPAGAIWIQGGTLIMEEGSEIRDMVGRAVYNEAGDVTIGGTISNIESANDVMWQGNSGYIMHMRVGATATLGATGMIDGNEAETDGTAVYVLGDCDFTTEYGSLIKNFTTTVIMVQQNNSSVTINGEITGCSNGVHIVQAQSGNFHITIGHNGYIHDNLVSYGAIYAWGYNDDEAASDDEYGTIDIYGKINNNISTDRGGAVAMANNGANLIVNMYEGAELCNNVSTQTGGGILVSCGTFTMYGGTISGNISGAGRNSDADAAGGGAYVRRGGQFIMYGGEITDNSAVGVGGGITFVAGDYNNSVPYVQLNGGTIAGNMMNAEVTGDTESGYTASGGISNDITVSSSESSKSDRYLSISDDVVLGEESIYMAKHNFYFENLGDGVKLGNASAASENSLKTASTSKGWSNTTLAAFWMQSDNVQELIFSNVGAEENSYDNALPVYALVMATDVDGDVSSSGAATVYAVTQNANDTMAFTIPATGENGCAISLVQPTTHYGTLTMEADPSSVGSENFIDDSTTLSYTATYELSENIQNQISEEEQIFILTINLDGNLTYVEDTFTINGETATATVNNDGTVKVTFKATKETGRVTIAFDAALHADDFTAGGQLVTASEVSTTISAGGTSTNVSVPSNVAITEMEPYTISATAGAGGSISPSGEVDVYQDDSVTFTITPDDGYEIADVLVDSVSVGAVDSYTFENVRAHRTIEAVFTEVSTVTEPDDTGVSDLLNTKDHMAYLAGYPNDNFGPDRDMTRAEAAQMFYNLLLDKNIPITDAFDDVDRGVWYAKAVNTLASLGIINGVGNNLYEPERAITRAEFTAIAMRFARLKTGGENIFSDVHEDEWFYDVVVGSIQYGWICGYPDGTFRPYDTITRAEVTTVVNRMLGRSADTDYVDSHAGSLRQFPDLEKAHWAYYDIVEATTGHTYSKDNGVETWTELN
jgi:hypothetical protein